MSGNGNPPPFAIRLGGLDDAPVLADLITQNARELDPKYDVAVTAESLREQMSTPFESLSGRPFQVPVHIFTPDVDNVYAHACLPTDLSAHLFARLLTQLYAHIMHIPPHMLIGMSAQIYRYAHAWECTCVCACLRTCLRLRTCLCTCQRHPAASFLLLPLAAWVLLAQNLDARGVPARSHV